MNTAVMERPPLVSIVGTVLDIGPAPAANRSGKIKLDDGKILSAFPDKLSLVKIGGSYDFGCVVTQKAGVNYHDVKAIRHAAPQPSAPPRSLPARQPAPVQRSAPVNAHVDPPPPPNHNGEFNRQTHPADARRMWICSQMNALIQSHQLIVGTDPVPVTDTIDMLATAYDQSALGNG